MNSATILRAKTQQSIGLKLCKKTIKVNKLLHKNDKVNTSKHHRRNKKQQTKKRKKGSWVFTHGFCNTYCVSYVQMYQKYTRKRKLESSNKRIC